MFFFFSFSPHCFIFSLFSVFYIFLFFTHFVIFFLFTHFYLCLFHFPFSLLSFFVFFYFYYFLYFFILLFYLLLSSYYFLLFIFSYFRIPFTFIFSSDFTIFCFYCFLTLILLLVCHTHAFFFSLPLLFSTSIYIFFFVFSLLHAHFYSNFTSYCIPVSDFFSLTFLCFVNMIVSFLSSSLKFFWFRFSIVFCTFVFFPSIIFFNLLSPCCVTTISCAVTSESSSLSSLSVLSSSIGHLVFFFSIIIKLVCAPHLICFTHFTSFMISCTLFLPLHKESSLSFLYLLYLFSSILLCYNDKVGLCLSSFFITNLTLFLISCTFLSASLIFSIIPQSSFYLLSIGFLCDYVKVGLCSSRLFYYF